MPLKIIWALLDLVTIAVLAAACICGCRADPSPAPEAGSELMVSNDAARPALTPRAAE
jgi:hypothetical protein